MKVDARHADFEGDDLAASDIVVFHEVVLRDDNGFHLDRAFQNARRGHRQ